MRKCSDLVHNLIASLYGQNSNQIKRLWLVVVYLNEILNSPAKIERKQLIALRKSIAYLECYLKENSSQEQIILK
jgi:hypothetical protein